jgi:endonuclease/exonuclease/phosphatase family metal-dependent hydrolase
MRDYRSGGAGVPFRVLTYNILKGGEDRLPLLLDVIRGQAPDVIAIQEANSQGNVAALARELGMELVYGEADTRYSVAWLSRLPILCAENHRRPVFRKTLLEIEVEWHGAPLRLFNVHLRAKLACEEQRAAEVAAILDILAPLQGKQSQPHLLVGDCNTIHPDDVFTPVDACPPGIAERVRQGYAAPRLAIARLLAAKYADCYRARHPERSGYTFATRLPVSRIDYIFASPQMAERLRGCDVVTSSEAAAASDHFPLWADFA